MYRNYSTAFSNLRILNTITGSPDEAWFYLITVAMEYKGGVALEAILQAQKGVNSNDHVAENLSVLACTIREMREILERMYENNLPQAFYKRVRPFLAGWTNDAALPDGLHYGKDCPGEKHIGASAAQSSLIQALDIALGIVHHTKVEDSEDQEAAQRSRVGVPGAYLKEMHQYMPREHREFLAYLQDTLTIRQYCTSSGDEAIMSAYNGCLKELEDFRSAHIKMVSFYIVTQAAKEHQEVQGTGGSNPVPFLKDIRDHVTKSKLS